MSKSLKFLLFLVMFIFAGVSGVSASERGEKTLGLRAGYNTCNESAVAGIFFQYTFSKHFRLAPNADYIFRHWGADGFSFNINGQFPIGLSSRRFDIYPLAGVSFLSMSSHSIDDDSNDVTTRTSRLGLNFGGGAEFYCTRSLKVYAEGKFNWVRHFNSGVFTVGIGYVF